MIDKKSLNVSKPKTAKRPRNPKPVASPSFATNRPNLRNTKPVISDSDIKNMILIGGIPDDGLAAMGIGKNRIKEVKDLIK